MRVIKWDIFPQEIEAYTITKDFGDMSFNHPDHQLILNNRKSLADFLKHPLNRMVAPQQTHSNHLTQVTINDGGKGIFTKDDAIPSTDALYTFDNDLFLWSFHADCTPILLYARNQSLIVSIHAGWVGTTNQIVRDTINILIQKHQIDPKELYAYIGPCISKNHFEVQIDVINKIKSMDFDTSSFYQQIDATHYLVDNVGLNKQQLLNLGVSPKNITIAPYCTIDDNDLFYSHRKKEAGRSITIIKKKTCK